VLLLVAICTALSFHGFDMLTRSTTKTWTWKKEGNIDNMASMLKYIYTPIKKSSGDHQGKRRKKEQNKAQGT
jgi:hypothetical protein